MGCDSCSCEKVFLYVNLTFAMYAGSILITAVRLTWDPTTYAWFRFLFDIQYRVTTGYLYGVGFFLAVLVYIGSSSVFPPAKRRLQAYFCGTVVIMASEGVYATYMYLSLRDWWENSQQAELLRHGLALQDDIKALLVILEKHHQVAEEVNNAMHEAEQDAPKNAYVIVACLALSIVLQVLGMVLSWLLQRRSGSKERMNSAGWEKSNRVMYSEIPQIRKTTEESRRDRSLDIGT